MRFGVRSSCIDRQRLIAEVESGRNLRVEKCGTHCSVRFAMSAFATDHVIVFGMSRSSLSYCWLLDSLPVEVAIVLNICTIVRLLGRVVDSLRLILSKSLICTTSITIV